MNVMFWNLIVFNIRCYRNILVVAPKILRFNMLTSTRFNSKTSMSKYFSDNDHVLASSN